MAFTRFTKNVLNVSALPDRVQNQAQTLKATFDQAGVDIKTALNALIVELEKETSASNIGADVQSVATKTVQAILTAFEEAIADRYTKTEAETLLAIETNNLLADLDVNLTTGVITVTKKDGTSATFDTAIEKVPAKFEIVQNGDAYALKITNVDGTSTQADITNFMNIYNFNNSDYITFEVTGTGTEKTVTANIKANSIGLDKLSLTVVSTLEEYMNSAKDSANAAKVSENNARASELNALESKKSAERSAEDAEYWARQAQAGGGGGGITEIPIATADTLGGIKVGGGLSITEDGVLSTEGGELNGASSNPIGTIIPFMGTTPPKDYLTCDGSVYNIADYLELASHFQNQFGSKSYFGGDGSTTFAVPDLRNEFLRGYGDLSNEIGVHQDATEHPFITTNSTGAMLMTFYKDASTTPTPTNVDTNREESGNWKTVNASNGNSGTMPVRYTSRPTNVAVLYCIKYTVSSEEIEIEATPTEGSNKIVTSGGVKAYVDEHGIKVLEASADNVIDFNTLTEPGIYLIKNCNDALGNTANSSISNSNGTIYSIKLEITGYKTSTIDMIYQRLTYNNVGVIKYRSYDKLATSPTWTEWTVSKIGAQYISAGTFSGQMVANATAAATLTNSQVRNIKAQTTDLTAGTSTLATGDIVLIYE